MPAPKPEHFDDIKIDKPAIKNRSLGAVPHGLQEMEQGFLLDRHAVSHASNLALQPTLDKLVGNHGWSKVGAITQAVISPEQIPKTRLRITQSEGKIEAVVTFKGINVNTKDSDELTPRFEMDLPIDVKALEKKYAHLKRADGKAWHASDSLDELLKYGSYGTVTKDRYKYKDPENGRTFDIDFYRWGEGAMDVIADASRNALEAANEFKNSTIKTIVSATCNLYRNLTVVDVELPIDAKRIEKIEDFPEALRPFLLANGKSQIKPIEITGDDRFKGRKLSSFEGSAGNFVIDGSTATLINNLAKTNTTKQK